MDDFGATGLMKEILDALAKQNQQQQEPPTGTQYADAKFQEGNEANNAAFNQQQQAQAAQQPQLQPLAPDQYYYGNQMVDAKRTFEQADALARQLNPTVTDAAQLQAIADGYRNDSHQFADNIRQIAKALNTDLSGIEDVSYADAARNLQTRQAKEVVDILSKRGDYGVNSKRYYEEMYMQLIGEGKSDRQARRLAERYAQQYQDDRVTYLRNAFNMYGRDGNYINDNGMPILQEIAMETPEVAQVYWQAYKNPAQAQDRTETVEDKVLNQTNAIEKILETFNGNSKLQKEQHGYNLEEIDRRGEIDLDRISAQAAENRKTIEFENEALFERFKKEHGYSEEQGQRLWNKKLQNLSELGRRLGLTGDAYKNFMIAGAGINLTIGKDGKVSGKVSAETKKSLNDLYDFMTAYRGSLVNQLKGEGGMINYEDNPKLFRQLATLDEQIENLIALGVEGITGTESKGGGQKLNLTGNWDNDAPIFKRLSESMKKQGYSTEQIRKGLYDIAIEYGYQPDYAMSALGLSKDEVTKWQR